MEYTQLTQAFDPRLTAEALVEAGQIVIHRDPENDRALEEGKRLQYFGLTLAEIDALPEASL